MQIYTATSPTHELRKVWRNGSDGPWQDESAEGYRYAKDFIYDEHHVDALDGVCDLLNRLSDVPNASLVLGKPLIESGGRTGIDFEDVATTLFLADLDSLEFDGTAEEAICYAFPFLRGRKYVYAYSPSSGFKPGHRLRVVFEVEPMDLTVMQIYAEQWNADLCRRLGFNRNFIDHGIYKAAGFVFTSRPKLKGLDDPHLVRAFVADGIDGPVALPKLPNMVEVDSGSMVSVGTMPTLRWDPNNRHSNSVFPFMVGFKTAFPDSTYLECWTALKAEYDRLCVSVKDQSEFGERYVQARYQKITGAKRKRKAFPTIRNELPLNAAEKMLSDEIKKFVEAREPGVKVIEAEAGIGKTYSALYWLGVETRYTEQTGVATFQTDLYVPNHNLSVQIEAEARSHGMTAYTELGRGQQLNGRPVCTKHEAISKVQGIVSETRKTFCGNDMVQCSDRPGCIWWDLHDKSLSHDLRIRTHAHLPLQIAKEPGVSRVPDFVVIDENFIGALVKQGYVEVKDLCDVTRHDMAEWLLKIAVVIKEGLTIERLEAAGFTADICKALIKAETELAPDVEITPDMSAEEALKAAGCYDGQWYKYASFWRRLRDALEARSLNRLRVTKNKKSIFLNWRQKIAGIPWDNETDRPRVPVLILSATIKRSMIEAVLPVDEWVTIEVEKHKDAQVTQVMLNASKASLLYGTGERVEEYKETNAAKKAAAAKFRDDLMRVSEGRHLFSYKSLVDEGVPLSGWFNAVEGLNDWAGGKIDIVGRPLPEPEVVEDVARAIHQDGAQIVSDGMWYNKRPIATVGEKGMAWCERHSDPRVEDVRWVVCEGAMMQAAARARHVRRSCEIRLFTNMVLPVHVDEVARFETLLPEEREYQEAPVRVASPALAKQMFSKFDGMSVNGIKQSLGNLHDWADKNDAELIEVRLKDQKHWSRVLIARDGWRYLFDRVEVVDWRDVAARADDNADRITVLRCQTEHARDVMVLREAFEREAWHDEDGFVPAGKVRGAWGEIDIGAMVGAVRQDADQWLQG